MSNAGKIISQLDAYTGANIWEDVIYHLPGFDGAATDAVNPVNAPEDHDAFVADGITYRHNPISGWAAAAATAGDDAEALLPEADRRVLEGSRRYGYAVAVYSVGPTGRGGSVRNLSREAAVRLAVHYRAAGHRQVHLSPDTCG